MSAVALGDFMRGQTTVIPRGKTTGFFEPTDAGNVWKSRVDRFEKG